MQFFLWNFSWKADHVRKACTFLNLKQGWVNYATLLRLRQKNRFVVLWRFLYRSFFTFEKTERERGSFNSGSAFMITSNRIVRFLWHQPSFGPLQLHLFLFLTAMKAEINFSSKKKIKWVWIYDTENRRYKSIQISILQKKKKAIKKHETDMQDQKRPYQTMISLKKSKHCHSVFYRTFVFPL